MKKVYLFFVFIISALLVSFNVKAEETTYQNVITDDTTIEEDFKVLGMDIEEYYLPSSYDYAKWYVVGMAESYADNHRIQTYFYFYNPKNCQNIELTSFEYFLNGTSSIYICNYYDVCSKNGLYKIKAFDYAYIKDAEISITKITGAWLVEDDFEIFSDPLVKRTEIESASSFVAKNSHNLADSTKAFTCELNFNSTSIIEDYHVVRVSINQDDNFINDWNTFWSGKEISLDLYFYNFNFPKHIKYDSVEYAKFQYDYLAYYEEVYQFSGFGNNKKELRNSELVVSEYTNDSKMLRVNDRSQEMTFPTFYLGNRFDAGQFDLKNKILLSGDEAYFDCDCSVLLDSTYRDTIRISGQVMGVGCEVGQKLNYTVLDKIEMLELHYKNNGILYKCQIIDAPVDADDIQDIIIGNNTWWEKFLAWLQIDFPKNLIKIFVCIGLGIFCVVCIIWFPQVLNGLIKFIKHIVTGIFAVSKAIWAVIKGVFKTIWFIVSLPFRLIGKFFKRE